MTVGAGSNSKGNREQEISTISRALKGLAKELNVPVIALSQLSRNVESRGGPKRPMLSDLRESGAIEQDADMVTFVYRPAYYKFEDPDVPPGASEIIIAKHRNGSTGEVFLKFIGEMTKFVDYEQTNFGDINMGSPMGGGMEDNYGIAQSRMNLDDENPF
jgi:replicative DNA helicase